MTGNLVSKEWDYTYQAKFYEYRPNYDPDVITLLINHVKARQDNNYIVADIGAGTANLSLLLLDKGLNVVAVEPNEGMSAIGQQRTSGYNTIKWVQANGTETSLQDHSVDWVTFGSSFNVVDQAMALKESHRILKNGGYFTCMWNHRDLDDPIQNKAENIIEQVIPAYERGVRRVNQKETLKNSPYFDNLLYIEKDFIIQQTIDNYINAWKSVKNKFWDVSTEEGKEVFDNIICKIREALPENFEIRYTTKAWIVKKVS